MAVPNDAVWLWAFHLYGNSSAVSRLIVGSYQKSPDKPRQHVGALLSTLAILAYHPFNIPCARRIYQNLLRRRSGGLNGRRTDRTWLWNRSIGLDGCAPRRTGRTGSSEPRRRTARIPCLRG